MSKFDEKVALYKKFMDDRNLRSNTELLAAVTKGLATVKNNFLIKKLGLSDSSELDAGIEEVMERIGKSERKKYRAVVYYMLVKKFDKEAVYGM
jgi:hypothetical protein